MKKKLFKKRQQYKTSYVAPSKKFKNPPDLDKRKKIKKIIWLSILFLLVVGLIYFFIYSPIFKIKKIEISGTSNIDINYQLQFLSQETTEGYSHFIFPNNNFFFVDAEELQDIIKNSVVLENVSVEKKLFNTLKITVSEKLPALIWNEGGIYYYIDQYGIIMKSVLWEDIKYDLPIISRGRPIDVVVGREVISASNIKFINEVWQKAQGLKTDWHFAFIIAPEIQNNEINFYSNEGWYAIFDTDNNIDISLNNLVNLIKQKIPDRTGLEYIDLRIESKLFYK